MEGKKPGSAASLRIAVVVPAYNEEVSLPGVLRELQAEGARHPEWMLLPVIVNDGSTDRTREILEELAPVFGAAAIHLPFNLGIGGAVQAGFQYAVRWGADVVLQLDGDGQHPPEEIASLIAPLIEANEDRVKADVTVGSRYVETGGGNVSSRAREWGTRVFSFLVRALTGVRIQDVTSGFRAFNAEAADFVARYYPDDYPEVEAYVPLVRRKFRIREVGVKMRSRDGGRSSIRAHTSLYYMVKVTLATLITLIRPLPERRKREGRE